MTIVLHACRDPDCATCCHPRVLAAANRAVQVADKLRALRARQLYLERTRRMRIRQGGAW